MTYEWLLSCNYPGMTNSSFSSFDNNGCLSCEECAHLLLRHEALKAEQTRVRYEFEEVKHLPDSVSVRQLRSKAEELATLGMEAREVYAEHRASHRRAVDAMTGAGQLIAA
jgi:hypothetical protein